MAPRTLTTVKKERDRLYDDLDVNYQEACEIMRVSYAAGASINSLCKAWNTTDRRTIRRMLGDTLTVDPLAADKPILSTFLHVEPDGDMTHAWVEQDNPVPPTAWVHEGRPTTPWWGRQYSQRTALTWIPRLGLTGSGTTRYFWSTRPEG